MVEREEEGEEAVVKGREVMREEADEHGVIEVSDSGNGQEI